jgi:hypothetical protein
VIAVGPVDRQPIWARERDPRLPTDWAIGNFVDFLHAGSSLHLTNCSLNPLRLTITGGWESVFGTATVFTAGLRDFVSYKNSQFSGLVLKFPSVHVSDGITTAGCVEAPEGEMCQSQKLVVAA